MHPMLQCGKPGPIPVPNTYTHKTSSRTGACTNKLQEKYVSGSKEEYFLFPHFLNIFPGHDYTSHAPFTLHQHSCTLLHSSDPFHHTDPSPKSPNLLIASKFSLFTPIPFLLLRWTALADLTGSTDRVDPECLICSR